jgi:hypothetical protein
MIASLCVLLGMPCPMMPARVAPQASDTIRLEVGSKLVNGTVYKPHAARVRVRIGSDTSRIVSDWTNELTVGDSAGRSVHRWVTKGTQFPPNGQPVQWELRQTFDAVSLGLLGYLSERSNGARTQLKIDGKRVTGTRKLPGDTTVQQVDVTLDQPGFVAAASDLVPLAVGFKEGRVMTAPVWAPNMTKSEMRIFTVVGQTPIKVEGTDMVAWKVEERRQADRQLVATWYLLDRSPYMVYGEVPLPNGQVQRMSEVEIPTSASK